MDAAVPWLAVSPDGHVHENGMEAVLEIKCPFSRRVYPEIPPHYIDQIQGIMGVLSLPWCDFCIWTPDWIHIHRVPFDRNYWQKELKPALTNFYNEVFLPAYLDREERRAAGDEGVPPMPV